MKEWIQNGKTDLKSLTLDEVKKEVEALSEKPFRAGSYMSGCTKNWSGILRR